MKNTIKGIIKKENKEGLLLSEVPVPNFDNDSVLIKVKKTGICGTDFHIYNWDNWARKTVPLDMVIGHEFSGAVVDKGKKVEQIKIGDRVTSEGHLICGYCRNCRAGKGHLCRNAKVIVINVN